MADFYPVSVAILAVSDTRTLDTDKSGKSIVKRLEDWGHRVAGREIVIDDVDKVRSRLSDWIDDASVEVIIVTGGTGITQRDITPEAIAPLVTKAIPGFGELFRWLSYDDIGTSTIQSRADAALCKDTLVFALPGSTGAVALAMDKILKEQLDIRHRPCNFIELLPRIRSEAAPNS